MHKKNVSDWHKHLDFMVVDVICLHIAFFLAYLFRHKVWGMYQEQNYRQIVIIMSVIDVLVAILFSSFKNVLKRGYFIEFTAAFKHVCLVECITIFYVFTMQKGTDYSRIVFYIFPVIYLLLTTVSRYLWKNYLKKNVKLHKIRSLLLVTTMKQAEESITELQNNPYEHFLLKGVVLMKEPGEENGQIKEILNVPVIAGSADVAEYCLNEWVDAAMIVLPVEVPYPKELIEKFQKMGIVVHRAIASKYNDSDCKQIVERIGNYTVLTTSMNYASSEELFLKRAMDIIGGLVGCILTGIICILFGPIIYMQSPGPIIFTQTRVGRNGRKFKIYKIRTMYMDAEERKKELMQYNKLGDEKMFKLDYDPRIIGNKKLPDGTIKKGIGSFLREYSLDEFPQMFNILRGDMSLVGTRPPTVDEWEKYELHHRARLAFRPGLTGMWQVSGRSSITDFEEVVRLDTKYISEWSLGLDVKIIAKTVLTVVKKSGAV
ncbi:MAG: sugar transferase [Lachnospiraceae bacterium]|nr:sugar transferase [Lachnospiraceae bacterium]